MENSVMQNKKLEKLLADAQDMFDTFRVPSWSVTRFAC